MAMKSWEEVVKECSDLIIQDTDYRRARIIANLKLGEIVDEIDKKSLYGDHAIEHLASSISAKIGRMIYPQRLYEAMAIFRTVGSIEKVEEIEKEVGYEVSWTWLLKNCSKKAENTKGNERKHKMNERMKKIETVLSTLDEFDIKKLSEDEKKAVTGIAIAAKQTADAVLSRITEPPESAEGTNSGKVVELIQDESTEETKMLKEVINYDEITLKPTENLEIHRVMTANGIGHAIVVSRETHTSIHKQEIPIEVVYAAINERNARFAMMYLEILQEEEAKVGGKKQKVQALSK